MKICLCDDDSAFLAELKMELVSHSFQTKHEFEFVEYHDARDLLERDIDYHILFLDIRFGKDDIGIEIAQELRSRNPYFYLVFVTSMPIYALEGYKAHPFAFLTKPLDKKELAVSVNELIRILEDKPEKQGILHVLENRNSVLIIINSIIMIRSDSIDKKRTIICTNGTHITREPLQALSEKLPHPQFTLCHQSYVVNLSFVSEVKKTSLLLSNGMDVPLGRTNKARFMFALEEYVGGMP